MNRLLLSLNAMNDIPQISEFGIAALFVLGGLLFVLGGLFTNRLFSPSRPNPEKNSTYECGEDPVGNARIQVNMRFYIVALLFLLFDAELIFLFPWATVLGDETRIAANPQIAWAAVIEGILFLLILSVGLFYAWFSNDINWVRPEPAKPGNISKIPALEYEQFNSRMK